MNKAKDVLLGDGDPEGIEKYFWQLIAAIGVLVAGMLSMFKLLISAKDLHLQSVLAVHTATIAEHKETIARLESKLDRCEEKHNMSEKETRDIWWTIANKFGTTPEKLQQEASDESGKIL